MLPVPESNTGIRPDARSDTHRLLAQGVSEQHRRLDRHPLLQRLMSRQLTPADYRIVMQHLRSCYALLEPALLACEDTLEWPGLNGFERYMARLPQLDRDLAGLSIEQPDHEQLVQERVHHTGTSVRINCQAAYLGVRYVLEGSTQGGLVIARCLERNLPSVNKQAFDFWSQQRLLAERWPEFLTMLARLDGHVEDQSRALHAARDTFALFLAVFNGD